METSASLMLLLSAETLNRELITYQIYNDILVM